jgi:hypothetical protein
VSAGGSSKGIWGRALAHGAQWRYLGLFVVVMLLPTTLAFAPIATFLQALFDHSPRHAQIVAALDSNALMDLLRQLTEPVGAAIYPGLVDALLAAAVVAPVLAGAAAAVAAGAGRRGSVDVRALLGGAGELFPRMFRMTFAAFIPFGIAFGGAAAAYHFANKADADAVLESTATRALLMARIASLVLLWLAGVTVEAGRAHLAAEPDRKSALVAWWSGVKLVVRRPAQVFGLCIVTTLAGVGLALVINAVRFRVVQSGPGSIALAFLLAQLGVVVIAWGRSSRLSGLVELIRAAD